jgi:hypothetical protein
LTGSKHDVCPLLRGLARFGRYAANVCPVDSTRQESDSCTISAAGREKRPYRSSDERPGHLCASAAHPRSDRGAIARAGTTTRADLSRLTGLSHSAVGECVAALLAAGVLIEGPTDAATSGRRRRAATLRLRAAPGLVLGVDLGHRHVGAAAAARDGQVLAERSAALDVDHRPPRALDLAAQLAGEALAAGDHTLDDVSSVAAGIPGPLDLREHTVRAPTILTEWVGIDPAAELGERLQRSVVVGNDADMGAIGEHRFGATRGLDSGGNSCTSSARAPRR